MGGGEGGLTALLTLEGGENEKKESRSGKSIYGLSVGKQIDIGTEFRAKAARQVREGEFEKGGMWGGKP